MNVHVSRRRQTGSVGVTILILLALGLCGLCGYQWWREAGLRLQVEEKNRGLQALTDEKAAAEAQGKRYEAEIKRLEADREANEKATADAKSELSKTVAALKKAEFDGERAAAERSLYKEAVDKANQAIKEQNEGVKNLNAEYKKLVEDRNEIVQKYNKLTTDYEKVVTDMNGVVEKYNTLVAQQAAAAAGEKK
jgi:chromosome segregation ATPase